ncbi:hypothetical protein LQW54_008884 [Pestalotiopsis sp. IQ-011]
MTTIFSPDAKNPEGFDRRAIKALPDPSKPKLKWSKTSDKGPWVTVVGLDLEQFSKEEWTMMKVPHRRGCYVYSAAKGPLIAPETGHLMQRDNPPFVAEQPIDLMKKVQTSK